MITDHTPDKMEHIQQLLDATPLACTLFDKNFEMICCNMEAVRLTCMPSKEEFCARYREILPPKQPNGQDSRALMLNKAEEALQKGRCSFEYAFQLPCDEDIPVEMTLVRVPWNGEYCIAGYARDLRYFKNAESELSQKNRLLEMVNTIAADLLNPEHESFESTLFHVLEMMGKSVDANRVYIWENYEEDGKQYSRQIYEWAEGAEPQQGKAITASIAYDDVPSWKEVVFSSRSINGLVRNMPEQERSILEAQDIKSVLIIPVTFENRVTGYIGFDDCEKERTFSDIEEQVLRSGALLITSAIARNEITKKLVEAREAALAGTHAKSLFLSRMSHELRTPLTAVIGMSEIARQAKDIEKIRYCFDKVETASRQLLSIVNDILDMSKIEDGKFELAISPFILENMLQNAINVVSVRIDEKRQDLRLRADNIFNRKLISDEFRLSQVIINLLNNANKFTPEYGNITLAITDASENADLSRLRFEVIDDGIGIEAEHLQNLFDEFEQAAGGRIRQFDGSGLGLSICKTIIGLMNGEIWVESELGKGSRFVFEIPVQWGESLQKPVMDANIQKDLRVLVVDEDEAVLESFSQILEGFRIEYVTASGGYEALERVKEASADGRPFHLIFIDWKTPGMSSGEISKKINGITDDNVFVVLISAPDWSTVEREAKQHGITEHLPKPVLPSALFNTILRLTGQGSENMPVSFEAEKYDWKSKTILLAEDIEINREIITTLLSQTGVSIEHAFDGKDAVELFLAKDGGYDLVLMDIQMPRMNGLESAREIRRLSSRSNVPILAMTANAFKDDIQACFDAGMNGHIAKPINVRDLFLTLSKYLDIR